MIAVVKSCGARTLACRVPTHGDARFAAGCACPSLACTSGVSEMIAVVETEEFLADVKGVLSEDEHDDLIL